MSIIVMLWICGVFVLFDALRRIDYDPDTTAWHKIEIVLGAIIAIACDIVACIHLVGRWEMSMSQLIPLIVFVFFIGVALSAIVAIALFILFCYLKSLRDETA